jgi:hypothetical protein
MPQLSYPWFTKILQMFLMLINNACIASLAQIILFLRSICHIQHTMLPINLKTIFFFNLINNLNVKKVFLF